MSKHSKDPKRTREKAKQPFLQDNPRVTVGDVYESIHAKSAGWVQKSNQRGKGRYKDIWGGK